MTILTESQSSPTHPHDPTDGHRLTTIGRSVNFQNGCISDAGSIFQGEWDDEQSLSQRYQRPLAIPQTQALDAAR